MGKLGVHFDTKNCQDERSQRLWLSSITGKLLKPEGVPKRSPQFEDSNSVEPKWKRLLEASVRSEGLKYDR